MNNKLTRMHSSRMRTGRSLTVCRSLLPGGVSAPGGEESAPGGVCSGGGVSAPGGCLLLGGVSAPRGECLLPGGCLLQWGVCSWGGFCSGGCVHQGCLLWGSAVGGLLRGVSAQEGLCVCS